MLFKEFFLVENIDAKLPILVKQFGNIPFFVRLLKAHPGTNMNELIRAAIRACDPTFPKADYATWILRLFKNGSLRGGEDYSKVWENLSQFDTLKKTGKFTAPKDINQYKTFGDLAKTLEQFKEIKSDGDIKRQAIMKGVEKLKEQNGYTLYKVTTSEAAAKLFRETEWCVKDPKFFKQYAKEDPNFYYIHHQDKEKWALAHFNSKQFKDIYDNPFQIDDNATEEEIQSYHDLLASLSEYQKQLAEYREPKTEKKDRFLATEFAEQCIEQAWYYTSEMLLRARKIAASHNQAKIIKCIQQMLEMATPSLEDSLRDDIRGGYADEEGDEMASLYSIDGIHDLDIFGVNYSDDADEKAADLVAEIESLPLPDLEKLIPVFLTMLESEDAQKQIDSNTE